MPARLRTTVRVGLIRDGHQQDASEGIVIGTNDHANTRICPGRGLGDRSQIREELPLSTRVHELAKELGLKSQELLERIQKWGLDVKANALASLDPPMVDRIRELMDQPASRKEVPSPAARHRPRPRRRAGRACRRSRHRAAVARYRGVTARPAASGPASGPVAGSRMPAPAAGPRRRLRRPARPVCRPPARAATDPRLVSLRLGPTRRLDRLPPAARAGTSRRAASGPPAPLGPPGSPGGGFSGTRPAGGPLSAHTPHRGTGPRPGGRPAAPRTSPATRASDRSAFVPGIDLDRPGIQRGFQPLKRDDYMSSAGTRP